MATSIRFSMAAVGSYDRYSRSPIGLDVVEITDENRDSSDRSGRTGSLAGYAALFIERPSSPNISRSSTRSTNPLICA